MKKLKSLFSRFYLLLVLAFFYLPILYVIVLSLIHIYRNGQRLR